MNHNPVYAQDLYHCKPLFVHKPYINARFARYLQISVDNRNLVYQERGKSLLDKGFKLIKNIEKWSISS